MKSYMTEQEKKRQKSKQLSWYYSSLHKISDYYPTVEIITISYHQVYRSAFGTKEEEKVLYDDATRRDNFLIECLNRECTCIGYNL